MEQWFPGDARSYGDRECWGEKGFQRGLRKLFGVIEVFIISTVVMISQVFTCIHQNLSNCTFKYV